MVKRKKTASDRHNYSSSSYRFRGEIVALLERLKETQRRTKTVIIEMALEEYGAKHGLWPLPDESEKN